MCVHVDLKASFVLKRTSANCARYSLGFLAFYIVVFIQMLFQTVWIEQILSTNVAAVVSNADVEVVHMELKRVPAFHHLAAHSA